MATKPLLSKEDIHYYNKLDGVIGNLNKAGEDVIRLDIGAPDLPTPDFIINALVKSVNDPKNHSYNSHSDTPDLREAWARYYKINHQVDLDSDLEILPLIGTKEGIFHFPFAVIKPGDVVLIPDPGYITYTRGSLLAGGVPFYLPLMPESNYWPDFSKIPVDILRRARVMWLNYPNNPTTATATLDQFRQALLIAQEYKIIICHDSAYSQITYEHNTAPSILQLDGAKEVVVEFNSLSKSHNMAGWRVGVMVGNEGLIKSLYTLKTNVDSGHFRPILDAATAALTHDHSWIKDRNEIYRQRRDLVINHLHSIGLEASIPKASIYVWVPLPSGWKAEEFAYALLTKAFVSVTPGTVFGKLGEGYFRISLTSSCERLDEAMRRFKNFVY